MNARSLQRFQEPARQSYGDDIFIPRLAPTTRLEGNQPRVGERRTVQIAEQYRCGFVIADEPAAVHIAIAGAMLKRNTPLPSRLSRRGTGVGHRRSDGFR